MSSIGFPDGQRITQWLGAPIAQATGRVINAGTVDDGPFNLSSWASVIVAIKPTGGNVTVTIKQKIGSGPATLEQDTSFVVNAGGTVFEAVVLFGDVVTLELTGSAIGTTVDYALYPSNTTTNAQATGNATPVIPRVTALPAAPSDGELCSFYPDQVNHPEVEWLCIFNLGTGYWDVIGGPPIVVVATGAVNMNAVSAWFDLLTKWTAACAGDFICTFNASISYIGGTTLSLVIGVGAGGVPGFFEWFTLETSGVAESTYSGAVACNGVVKAQAIALYGDPQGGAGPNMTSNGPGNAATRMEILPTRIK